MKLLPSKKPFRRIGYVPHTNKGEIINEQEKWTKFSGRMGTFRPNRILRPVDANGGGLSTYQTGVANAQMVFFYFFFFCFVFFFFFFLFF